MSRILLIAALLIASPLLAQTSGDLSAPVTHLGSATLSTTAPQTSVPLTPEAPAEAQPVTNVPATHLGSATPSPTVPETPVETPSLDDRGSNAILASSSQLAARRFELSDVSYAPGALVRGDMADTSISLGDYARNLRDQKHKTNAPAAAKVTARHSKHRER